jgi:hypothetical protein
LNYSAQAAHVQPFLGKLTGEARWMCIPTPLGSQVACHSQVVVDTGDGWFSRWPKTTTLVQDHPDKGPGGVKSWSDASPPNLKSTEGRWRRLCNTGVWSGIIGDDSDGGGPHPSRDPAQLPGKYNDGAEEQTMRIRTVLIRLIAVVAALAVGVALAQSDWPVYGRDPGAQRYSPLTQINPANVSTLIQAWTYDTKPPSKTAGQSKSTPLVVNNVLYFATRIKAWSPSNPKQARRSGASITSTLPVPRAALLTGRATATLRRRFSSARRTASSSP